MDRRKFLLAGCASMISYVPRSTAIGCLPSITNTAILPPTDVTICVVGIGPLGGSTLLELGPFAARPRQTSLSNISHIKVGHLCIGSNGIGLAYRPGRKPQLVDVLPDVPALGAENCIEFTSRFLAADIVFVVADFDTPSACRSAQVVTQLARRGGAFTIALGAASSAPSLALSIRRRLQGINADSVLLLSKPQSDHLAEHVMMIVSSAATPGLIGLDIGDIAYALSGGEGRMGPGMLTQIAFGIAEGPIRAETAAAMAVDALDLSVPLPDGVFVKISTDGRSLQVAEVNQVLRIVRQKLSEDIFLLAATSVGKDFSSVLKVEILSSRWAA